MNKKKQGLILSLLAILTLILITGGVTYAFFSYLKEGTTDNVITTGSITFFYTEVDKVGNGIQIENAFPMSDEIGKVLTGSGEYFDFKITSNTMNDSSIPYEITARKSSDSTLNDEAIKLYLTEMDGTTEEEVILSKYNELLQTSKVDESKYTEKVVYSGKVPANAKDYEQSYRLRIWISDDVDFSKGDYNDKKFTITVNVYANAKVVTEEDIILEQNANISKILVGDEQPTKVKEQDYDYEIKVGMDTTRANILVETESPYATVKIEKIDGLANTNKVKRLAVNKQVMLTAGNNYFKVIVTSEDKEVIKEFIIKISVESVLKGDSILSILQTPNLEGGYYIFRVKGDNETVDYPVHLITYSGNQEWNETMTFGDEKDISDGTNYAQNMVIVKVNGNVTVGERATISPYYTNYGGPKGFTLYVTGQLINNGTIENRHGAYAKGENVYLWKNADGSYEFVPAIGGNGGVARSGSYGVGYDGSVGSGKRSTGGGGSGSSIASMTSGAGGKGTSYSGGTGGGSGAAAISTNPTSGANYGGKGGNSPTGGSWNSSSSGVGNPSGDCTANCTVSPSGTGGLLIIYSNEYKNNGTIDVSGTATAAAQMGGGSSGGGTLNIFTNQSTGIDQLGIITDTRYSDILGNTSITGGVATGTTKTGGAGGSGTLNIGSVRNNQYYDLKEVINQDKDEYLKSVTIKGDSIVSILEENNLDNGYYYFVANGSTYPVHLYSYDGNQTWSSSKKFGDEKDVSDGTNYAQNMVIVKVNGNLTINKGVTIQPYFTNNGGPKGFTLFVTGNLVNNGIIQNKHGAYAKGENVYLWKNTNGTYEYVPAIGGNGGVSRSGSYGAGYAGDDGSKRSTGGGGSGSAIASKTSGSGGKGTSYSGGTGGGSGAAAISTNPTSGDNYGGKGGNSPTSGSWNSSSSGVGNPSGDCTDNCKVSPSGTGGLLIIYSNEYKNNGTIDVSGTAAGAAAMGGGSSGGGSLNVFYKTSLIQGTTNVLGGSASGTSKTGGAGGNGSQTYTQIYFE